LDGDLFPLANQSFAWKSSSGKYLYQPSFLPSPGELSGVFILDTDILAFQHINLTTQIIQDYLIHENLEEIQTYYASCDTINSLQVPSYLIPNPHSWENLAFTFISQLLLWKNSS
jgi:hypothetical protein